MKPLNHICAVIPTYNNAGTIADVVRRVYAQMDNIIVVADGPTDNTLNELGTLGLPITVVMYSKNAGKGTALKRGFEKARQMGFTHVLTIDADGQHYPEDIPALYRMHTLHPDSIIIGSRGLKQANMPGKNTFANKFSNFWFAIQTGLRLPDTQTGFRIYPLKHIRGERLMTSRYEAELELLVFSAWANVPIIPVPIRVYYPSKEERVSHFQPAYDFARISLLNTFLCVLAVVYGLPRRWWRTLVYLPFFACFLLFYVHPSMWLFTLFNGDNDDTHHRLHAIVKSYCRFLLQMVPGATYQIHLPKLNEEKPTIYICNHNSLFDILLMMSVHGRLAFVTKDWILHNPLFCKLAKGFDIIPSNLGPEAMLETVRERVNRGYSVMIFPEGTRSGNGEVGRFHRGAFYLAEQLNLPVCPLMIRGAYELWCKNEIHIGHGSDIQLFMLPTPEQLSPDTTVPEATRIWGAHYRKWADNYAYPMSDE